MAYCPRRIRMRTFVFSISVCAVAVGAAAPFAQQERRAVTAADYARAEKFLSGYVTPLVYRSGVRANWLPDDPSTSPGSPRATSRDERFWYRVTTENGSETTLVDPAKASKAPCTLPECSSGRDASGRGGRGGTRNDVPSPDGTRTAYIKDWNLWVRDVATGREKALTTDGVQDFGYATDNAGWVKSDRAILIWSPDSKKIATFQQDQRKVGDMDLVRSQVGHPQLEAWKYPLPGDANIAMLHRVVIDVDTARVTRLRLEPDQHRSTLCDHITCRGGDWADVYWSPDATKLAFVSTSRDHRQEVVREAQIATGEVRDVLEETVSTFFESGNGAVNWRYLPASNEIIWFSERDNWGQLYLYDLRSGRLKSAITTGEGNVTQVVHVDEKARVIHFIGVGKEKGRDPYFSHLYRV